VFEVKKLKKMADNHIIIGLGGRGGDTLKAFRKTLFKKSLTKEKAEEYAIQYLYVDSDEEALNKGWNDEIGVDYSIDDYAKINSRESVSWDNIQNNISQYPTINPWIGDKKEWDKLTINSDQGSSQLRKLGRIYFASSVYNGQNNSFEKKLRLVHDNVVRKSGNNKKTYYHVLVGLSGGSGSGTIIDVISLISKYIQSNHLTEDKIIIYAILPERNVQNKNNLGFYYSNAYAALKEINAIAVKEYKPIDIQEYSTTSNNRIDTEFESCFIFTNENENGNVIDYKEGLPNMIGDFLYQSIIILPTTNSGQDAYKKLTENGVIKVETDIFSGKEERSLYFRSVSIKKIEIPEIEVIDLYGAKLMQQLINQQKFNNWQDTKGYLDALGPERISDFVGNLSKPGNIIQKCKLTLNHLSLKTSDDFKNSDDEWDSVSERLCMSALKNYSDGKEKTPIQYVKSNMDTHFASKFRGVGMGVAEYWNIKRKDIEQQSNYFYTNLEYHLFQLWVSHDDNSVGINEIKSILSSLQIELNKISQAAANKINHLEDSTTSNVKDSDPTNAYCIKEINVLTANFSKLLNLNKKGTFETAVGLIKKLYKNKTDIIAYSFSVDLIQKLIQKIEKLIVEIEKITENIDAANDKLAGLIGEKEKIFTDPVEKTHHDANVKMLYKDGSIEDEFDLILREKNILKDELRSFRQSINQKCTNGINSPFKELGKYFNVDMLTSQYLYDLNGRIPKIYEKLESQQQISPDDKLVGRNILNYLQNSYNSFSDVEAYFKKIAGEIGTYAKITGTGKILDTLDPNKIKNYAAEIIVIQHPPYNDTPEKRQYEAKFVDLLNRVFPNVIIEANAKSNEIIIFKARANMALRSFEMVSGMMHAEYNKSLLTNKTLADLTLHTEGISDTYPKLLPFEDKDKESEFKKLFDNKYLAYYLLGHTLKFIEKVNNKYIFNSNPEDITSIGIDISSVNSKFYSIVEDVFKKDMNSQPPIAIEERVNTKVVNTMKQFLDKRENKSEDVCKSWIGLLKTEILSKILEEDYEGDKSNKEFHTIINSVNYLEKDILKLN
jgi:hypothetical protein